MSRLLRRLVQRHCRECGHRMERMIASAGHDTRSGRRLWVWWWGCPEAFRGYGRLYLDGRPYHDARRISTSPARRRLEHE